MGNNAYVHKEAFMSSDTSLVIAAMKELTEKQQLIIALHCQEQLSFQEVGNYLNCSPELSEILYFKAVQQLEEVMKKLYPDLIQAIHAKVA
jgi:DNA-directed RNA polymerase specialized sigma24 family protein